MVFKAPKKQKNADEKARKVLTSAGISAKAAKEYVDTCDDAAIMKIISSSEKIKELVKGKDTDDAQTALDFYIFD